MHFLQTQPHYPPTMRESSTTRPCTSNLLAPVPVGLGQLPVAFIHSQRCSQGRHARLQLSITPTCPKSPNQVPTDCIQVNRLQGRRHVAVTALALALAVPIVIVAAIDTAAERLPQRRKHLWLGGSGEGAADCGDLRNSHRAALGSTICDRNRGTSNLTWPW